MNTIIVEYPFSDGRLPLEAAISRQHRQSLTVQSPLSGQASAHAGFAAGVK